MDFDVDALTRKLQEKSLRSAEVSRSSAAAGPTPGQTPQGPPVFKPFHAAAGGAADGSLGGDGGIGARIYTPHGNGQHAPPDPADVAADFSEAERTRLEVRALDEQASRGERGRRGFGGGPRVSQK